MNTEDFEKLVAKAIYSLPDEFRERMENVDVIVADAPTPTQLRRSGLRKNQTLLGLYEGVPLTHRTGSYSYVMPDKITIFQRPIESIFKSDTRIIAEIQRVVKHEIAHHFGIDDDRLEELGI